MSLPAGVTTCNVIFNTPLSFAGGTGTATLTVRPTQTIIWAATGQPLGAFSDTVTTSAQPGSMALPVVDQPGFVDSAGNTVTNWAYTADVLWTVGTQNLSTHKSFQLLTGQTSVTFDLIPDGNTTIAVTAPTATVTSVNGATGPITLDSASVGLSNVDNTSDANKPLSTAATNALALKQDAASLDTTNAGLVNDSASATAAALNATIVSQREERIGEYAGALKVVRLNLPTYDGNPSTTHPTVVDAGTAGWNGYQYWMCHTPYPDGPRENPSILASTDGVNWITPAGLVNPIVTYAQYQALGYDYGSDPQLFFDGAKLVLFHRPASEFNGVTKEAIYRMESSDGITWNSPGVKVLDNPTGNVSLIAPAVNFDGTTLQMWVVNGTSPTTHFDRYVSTDGGFTFTGPTACTLISYSGHNPWHIGMTKVGSTYYIASNSKVVPNECVLFTSTDGLTWTQVRNSALPRSGDWYDVYGYYRTCLIPSTAVPGTFDVYASTMTSAAGRRSISLYKSFDWLGIAAASVQTTITKVQALDTPYTAVDSFDGRISSNNNIGLPDLGGAWTAVNVTSSAVRLNAGQLQLGYASTPQGCHNIIDAKAVNGTWAVDVTPRSDTATCDTKLLVKYVNQTTFLYVGLVITADGTTTNRLRIGEVNNGVSTTIIDVSPSGFTRGVKGRLSIQVSGSTLTAYVNGVQVSTGAVNSTDWPTFSASTIVGVSGYNDNLTQFDNVSFKRA